MSQPPHGHHHPVQGGPHPLHTSTETGVPTTAAPPTTTTTTRSSHSRPHCPDGVEVTTRSDLSLLHRVLRAAIRPLRPRLVRPRGPAQPAGSPRLSPPRTGQRGVEIAETRREGVWMYRFRAARGKEKGKGSVDKAGHRRGTGRMMSAAGGGGGQNHGEMTTTTPPPTSGHRYHRVYYFCGGGFQSPPAPEHWRFLVQLTRDLDLATHRSNHRRDVDNRQHANDLRPDAEIELVLVSYPLAPRNPASESLRILRAWLAKMMDEAGETGHTLSLMGDSSGGNVVLSLGFWAVQTYRVTPSEQHQQQQRPVPSRASPLVTDDDSTERANGPRRTRDFPLISLISISGPTDLTNSNPEIRQADKLDCILTAELAREVAAVWTGNNSTSNSNSSGKGNVDKNPNKTQTPSSHEPIPLADPSVSPLLHPDAAFRALRDRGVHVHGVVGTHDVLAPDAREFVRKCRRLGVAGRWLVWEGQMHCFPLAGGRLGLREGNQGREFVAGVLRRECGTEDADDR